MTLYDYAWSRIFEITQKQPANLRMLLTNKIEYPKLIQDELGYTVILSKPKKKHNGYTLHGFDFTASEQAAVLQMLCASIYHLGLHVISSDFRIYRNWSKNKDLTKANFTKSIVEDAAVNAYLKIYWPNIRPIFSNANAFLYQKLKPLEELTMSSQSICQAVISRKLTGNIKGKSSKDITQDSASILSSLNELGDNIYQKSIDLGTKTDQVSIIKPSDTTQERLDTADRIWEILSTKGPFFEFPALPYGEYWGDSKVFTNNLNLAKNYSEVLKSTYATLDIDFVKEEYTKYHKRFTEEAIQIFEAQENYSDRMNKIVKKYLNFGQNLHFKSYSIPNEDFSEYSRKRSKMVGQIRRILEEVIKVKQAVDENSLEEAGAVDLQAAIQVLSSNSPRKDIFIKDENIQKSESWAILVDSSLSLGMTNGDAKSIAICLAEVAKEIFSHRDSWGLFSFNDTYQIIKDFHEPYSNRSRAKIGGLQSGGLSLLPDAIELTAKALVKTSEDVKLLLIITDGIPTGYEDIDLRFTEILDKISKSNLNPIIIGLGNDRVKRLMKNSFSVENNYELMKKFVNVYLDIHSTN